MKGAQSLRKGKVVGMGLPKTFPPQIPQNLLYFQQNLSFQWRLVTFCSPGDPITGQSKRIKYPQTSDISDIPVAETAHGRSTFILWIYSFRGTFPALSDILDTRQEWEQPWELLTLGVNRREGFFLAEEVILYKRQQMRILCQGFCQKPKGERKIRMQAMAKGAITSGNGFEWAGMEGGVLEQVTWNLQACFLSPLCLLSGWLFGVWWVDFVCLLLGE